MAFKIGAGSIRAYPHAENTGLVISDAAKIGTFSDTSKLFAIFLLIEAVFAKNIAGGDVTQTSRRSRGFLQAEYYA